MNAAFFCLECEQNHMVISSVSSSPVIIPYIFTIFILFEFVYK